ncbi:MAG TPA: ADP-ribosylation factor-like protein [Candidatus Nanopelagicaceae bacterium]|nr:ADP-ribosylation factor-like protein [Candidatus Nanopelagicaceae bacterium]
MKNEEIKILRQIHIFYSGKNIYNHTYALALGDEELNNVRRVIQSFLDMPMMGKTFHRPVSENFQIFHKSEKNVLFLFITDLVDSLEYISPILDNTIKMFNELFPNPTDVSNPDDKKREFVNFLREQQHKLHSKITIVGPINSGKTQLFNMIKSDQVRQIMNFARASIITMDNLKFDLWDFELKDNFSLLWSKFIQGSDLVILLFDLSNYHIRVINHFFDLQKQESKFSKLLILGNKRDLINKHDLKIAKNELDISDFEEISLIETGVQEKIKLLIARNLNLKKLLPHRFIESFNEAKSIENDGNLILAIARYKELVKISSDYQDFTYISTIKEKIAELQEKINEQTEMRKQIESKKKFEIPGKIQFTRRIQVQPLPSNEPQIKPPPIEVPKATIKVSRSPVVEQKTEDLLLFSKPDTSEAVDIDKEDITLDIDEVIPEEKRPTLEQSEIENEAIYPEMLLKLIEQSGSTLSLKLCSLLITELQKTLARPLTIEDIESAANFFVKHDSL